MSKLDKKQMLLNIKDKLKEEGLDVAEESLARITNSVLDVVEESIRASGNGIELVLLHLVEYVRKELNKQIDKVDGVEGNLAEKLGEE